MSNYRYVRIAVNEQGWKRPHSGRMGGADYVGNQGLAHEDWNFAHDLWDDGRYHLYFHATPAGFKDQSFNFVLGVHAKPAPLIAGFVENARYGVSKLPRQVLLRRAREVFALNSDDSLGPNYRGMNAKQIAKRLEEEVDAYRVSVAPSDLHILAQPVPMPREIYEVRHPGYRALRMNKDQYDKLKLLLLDHDTKAAVDQEEEVSFPEGALVERLHRSRERNRTVVKKAKAEYIKKNLVLSCEACGFEPEKHFREPKMRNRIIEAHHDVALADDRYRGQTSVSDLRMLCPNCHRAIHTIRPWISVEKLREILTSNK